MEQHAIMFIVFILLCVNVRSHEVIAIGDLHGDYYKFMDIMERLNFTKTNLGVFDVGDKFVVQTGDVLDRGREGVKILEYFINNKNINIEMLLGNHEELNIMGMFGYVNTNELTKEYTNLMLEKSYIRDFILSMNTIKIIDGIVYVHAGLDPIFIEREFVMDSGKNGTDIVAFLNDKVRFELSNDPKYRGRDSILGSNGPLWLRDFSKGRNCDRLYRTLKLLGAKHMVVGHQVQNRVSVKCFDPLEKMSIICIDVGMSEAYNDAFGVVKIVDGKVLYIYEDHSMIAVDLPTNTVIP